MSLESGTRIADLVPTNPVGATDFASQGDDHIRLLKACIQGSFPSLGATAVAATAEQLNNLASIVALSIIGRAANSTGAPAAITAAANDRILRRVADALDFGQLTAGMFPNTVVPDAALSSNIPLKNAANTLAQLLTLSAGITVSAGAVTLPAASVADAALSSNVPLKNVSNTFTASIIINPGNLVLSDGTVSSFIVCGSGANYFGTSSNHPVIFRSNNLDRLTISANGSIVTGAATGGALGAGSVNAAAGMYVNGEELGYRDLYQRTFSGDSSTAAADRGRMCSYVGSGGHTFTLDADVPDNGVLLVANLGAGAITIARSGSMYWLNGSGSAPEGARTLAVGGVATVRSSGSGNYSIWGNGLS